MTPQMAKAGLKPYFALHRDVAGRVDLAPADKLLWAALADFLPREIPEAEECWITPPIGWLARKTALSARQVRRSLRRLEAAGLIQRRARTGRPTAYAVMDPPPLEPAADPARRGNQGGQNVRPTPDKLAAPPDKLSAPGEDKLSALLTRTFKGQRARTFRLEPENLAEVAALEATRQAWGEIKGIGLPAGWVAAVLDDCQVGASEIWTELTADDLQAAQQLVNRDKGQRMGPWAVRAYMADHAEKQLGAKRREQRALQAGEQSKAEEQALEAQRHVEEEYFDRLTGDEQAGFVTDADRQCRITRAEVRRDVVPMLARQLAWNAGQGKGEVPSESGE